jgi:hypothetical protein
MGAAPSIEIERQERYVQQNYNKVVSKLGESYNSKLRQEYNGHNYKDEYVLENDWNKTKRR